MPTLGEILEIKLTVDTSGLEQGTQQAATAFTRARLAFEQIGQSIERAAKSAGIATEGTAAPPTTAPSQSTSPPLIFGAGKFPNVAALLLWLATKMVRWAAETIKAGAAFFRQAESINLTVERLAAYRQAFQTISPDSGITATMRKIKLDLSAFPLVYSDWMNSVERLTGKVVRGKEPEQILQEINEAAVRRRLNAAQLQMWLGGGLPLSSGDFGALAQPGFVARETAKQRVDPGTPTSEQGEAMAMLQKDVENIKTVSSLLALQTATMAAPFLKNIIETTITVMHWLRGVAKMFGLAGSETEEAPAPAPTAAPAPGQPAAAPGRPAVPSAAPAAPSTATVPAMTPVPVVPARPAASTTTAVQTSYGLPLGKSSTGVPVNLKDIDPELLERLQRAYAEAPPDVQRDFRIISGFRTRKEQEKLWEEGRHGALYAVARPGTSRHEKGGALDIDDVGSARDWFHRNAARFGLAFPVRNDPGHIQLLPNYPNVHTGAAAAVKATEANRMVITDSDSSAHVGEVIIHLDGGPVADPKAVKDAIGEYLKGVPGKAAAPVAPNKPPQGEPMQGTIP